MRPFRVSSIGSRFCLFQAFRSFPVSSLLPRNYMPSWTFACVGYSVAQKGNPERAKTGITVRALLMEEVSLVNYSVKSFHVPCEGPSHVLPSGWTLIASRGWRKTRLFLLFPGVNETRTEVYPPSPPLTRLLAPPSPDVSTVVLDPFNSSSSSSKFMLFFFFGICIPNKQEIVFICMQMCLSPRLRF